MWACTKIPERPCPFFKDKDEALGYCRAIRDENQHSAADDTRPWISHGAQIGVPLVNGEYFMVSVSHYSGDQAGPARAKRIAACMNACHGMEDDVLGLLNDFAPRATNSKGEPL